VINAAFNNGNSGGPLVDNESATTCIIGPRQAGEGHLLQVRVDAEVMPQRTEVARPSNTDAKMRGAGRDSNPPSYAAHSRI